MKKIISIFLCFSILLQTGCATIVHGKRQTIHVETNVPGVTVTTNRSSEPLITPADLVLKRKTDYDLTFEKAGYKTQRKQVDQDISGWFWMNILSWGIIGIIVDLTNGAAYKLDPEEMRVEMEQE